MRGAPMRRCTWLLSLLGLLLLPAMSSAALARYELGPPSTAALEAFRAEQSKPSYFVVGGSSAAPGQFPWTSFVVIFENDNPVASCTGSLVGEQVVVTAAHCVLQTDGPNAGDPLPNLGLLVVTGTNNLDDPSAPVASVPTFYAAPFDPITSQNDLAVLVLDTPSPAQAVPMMRADQAGLAVAGAPSVVSGWGLTSSSASDIPSLLQYAPLPVLSNQTCVADYPVTPGSFLFDPTTNLCAGYQTGGVGACEGDSGGPLTLDTPAGALLIGATSWGNVPCAQPAEPTVFTRISAFVSQVVNTLAANPDVRAGLPQISTGGSGAPSDSQVAVSGSVQANGLATRVQVQYGTSLAYGQTADIGYAGAGHQVLPLAATLSGLLPSTGYHYRFVADNAAGLSAGADAVFATEAVPTPPSPPTPPPSNISGTPPVIPPSNPAEPVPKKAGSKKKAIPCAGKKGKAKKACLLARRRALALKACNKKPTPKRPACRIKARKLR
jgi:trypsin